MNDVQVMEIILKYLIADASNRDYRKKLNTILQGIEGHGHIEETKSPRYQSILLFGTNIFPFSIATYRAIVQEIQKEGTGIGE